MPWKARDGSLYYYRSVRRGGRVASEYVGCGEVAELVARIDAEGRAGKGRAAAAWRAERSGLDRDDRSQAARFALVEALVGLALESAGYRRHHRGEWRARRMGDKARPPAVAGPGAPPGRAGREEALDVLRRAERGDESALPRLRELFRADAGGLLVGLCGGDLAAQAEAAATGRMAGENLAFKEALTAKLAALRLELAGPEPTAVVRLLAERAALCWLDAHDWELRHNHAMRRAGGLTPAQSEHYQKMRDRSQRRYLQALKALAQVQKMGPAIQINVARNQLNVSGGGPA